jgi:hypothetical protein
MGIINLKSFTLVYQVFFIIKKHRYENFEFPLIFVQNLWSLVLLYMKTRSKTFVLCTFEEKEFVIIH